jgi:hypothetical protein
MGSEAVTSFQVIVSSLLAPTFGLITLKASLDPSQMTMVERRMQEETWGEHVEKRWDWEYHHLVISGRVRGQISSDKENRFPETNATFIRLASKEKS